MVSFLAIIGGQLACEGESEPQVAEPATTTVRTTRHSLSVARRHLLSDVAAIIEADVASMRFEYTEQNGPRTVVTLANMVVHAGATPDKTEFAQLGGPLPNGHSFSVSELPTYSIGSRYILFLSARPWLLTPVWSQFTFRIERFPTRSVVLGPTGQPVLEFGAAGVRIGTTQVVSPSPEVDSLAPQIRSAQVTEFTPDVASAMQPEAFVRAAVELAIAVGAPLGAPVSFSPDPSRKWNAPVETVPPASALTSAAQGVGP